MRVWKSGGETTFTSYAEVVSRHYFGLDALRAYGDGQDDFGSMPEEALFMARQAAAEVFERNARRSFVHRIGRTARAGRSGRAFTLISGRRQFGQLRDIMAATGAATAISTIIRIYSVSA